MRLFRSAGCALMAVALAVLSISPAYAQSRAIQAWDGTTYRDVTVDLLGHLYTSSVGPTAGTTTDKGGTLTAGGAAQNAIAANTSRKGWCIQNDPAATETLYVNVSGTASATTGVALSPGQQACNAAGVVSTAAVSVFAATISHRWYGSEVQ